MSRKTQVKALLESGLSIKEVAYELGIAYNTAKAHRRAIGLSRTIEEILESKMKQCIVCKKAFIAQKPSWSHCSHSCANERIPSPCSKPGCLGIAKAHNLCNKHYLVIWKAARKIKLLEMESL